MTDRVYLLGLIGAGVRPSLTPPLHMAEARELGLNYIYRTIDIGALGFAPAQIEQLLTAAKVMGFDALNITHLCKRLVVSHLDRMDEQAARLGAVNTVVFDDGAAVGYNTDVSGFATAFRNGLPGAPTAEVVQLGAGGAGAAVADALLEQGITHLTIVDIDEQRCNNLAIDLADRFPGSRVDARHPDGLPAILRGADGLVHCTPTGMADHPGVPLEAALLHPGLWVADIVYRPLDTALLQAARSAGYRTLHGGHMAVHQAAETFRLVTGLEPDAERMLRHFQRLVDTEKAADQ